MTDAKKPAARKPRTTTASATKRSASATSDRSRRSTLEIKIGVQHSPREIVLDVDQTADALEKALTDATTKGNTLVLEDVKGRRVLLPAAQIAYIEIGEPTARRVGFGAL